MIMKKKLKVEGMHCASCEMLLSDVVSGIDGVEEANADYRKGTVTIIVADPGTVEEAKKAIEKEGYKVVC